LEIAGGPAGGHEGEVVSQGAELPHAAGVIADASGLIASDEGEGRLFGEFLHGEGQARARGDADVPCGDTGRHGGHLFVQELVFHGGTALQIPIG
jgi:hypothetical protein